MIRNASLSNMKIMATPPQTPVQHRRRGPQLESALFDAAWDELVEIGYARLTMESVAARAHTGIAVLYRRWANKDQLVLAAIEHYGLNHPVEIPDTGNLRGDLLGLLTAFSEGRAAFMAVTAGAALSGLLADTGLTPAQIRERLLGGEPRLTPAQASRKILGGQSSWRSQIIYRRAHDRGEIDLDQIPPAVLALPFDLVRHDLLMNLRPLKPARIESIVDELFLPLVRRH